MDPELATRKTQWECGLSKSCKAGQRLNTLITTAVTERSEQKYVPVLQRLNLYNARSILESFVATNTGDLPAGVLLREFPHRL